MGDSVENGVIRGKALGNGVSDGNIWAPWGKCGRIWDCVGGVEGAADGCDVHDLSSLAPASKALRRGRAA